MSEKYTRKQRRNKNRGCRGKGKNKLEKEKHYSECFICHEKVHNMEMSYMGKLKRRDPITGLSGVDKRDIYVCNRRYVPTRIIPKGVNKTFETKIPEHYRYCRRTYINHRLPRNDFDRSKIFVDALNTFMKLRKICTYRKNYIYSEKGETNNPKIIEIWDKENKIKKIIAIHPKIFNKYYRVRSKIGIPYKWYGPKFNNNSNKSNGESLRFNTRNMIEVNNKLKKSKGIMKRLIKFVIPRGIYNEESKLLYLKTLSYFNLYHILPDPNI